MTGTFGVTSIRPAELMARAPVVSQSERGELHRSTTPQDRARSAANQASGRTASEVFASPAPPVLSLHTYLQQHLKQRIDVTNVAPACDALNNQPPHLGGSAVEVAQQVAEDTNSQDIALEIKDVTVSSILDSRLGEDEIRQVADGRFNNYTPGEPSDTLYIKNLSSEVTEQDLVALFLRYQGPGEHLLFRLMQSGRMKGQAFVTFPDAERAADALRLVNGYKLKDRPMIIEFGRRKSETPKVE